MYAARPRIQAGITSEVALIIAFFLGVLTQSSLTLAAGTAVVVMILLVARIYASLYPMM